MRIIDEATAKGSIEIQDAIDVVEDAFGGLARKEAKLFDVVIGDGFQPDEMFAIKSGNISTIKSIGLKIGSYWPANKSRGLENHNSTVLLFDHQTGYPKALVSASYLTALRTASADAVATKHLARKEASNVAIVGAGHQAWFDLLALRLVRDIKAVYVWNRSAGRAEAFAENAAEIGLEAYVNSLEETVRSGEIIVTATASSVPLVKSDWVQDGAHISAMGADAKGKQEIDVVLLERSRLFADLPSQSANIGEFQTGVATGAISIECITEIGDVINGSAQGRRSESDITIFDSSGIALQDIAICEKALQNF